MCEWQIFFAGFEFNVSRKSVHALFNINGKPIKLARTKLNSPQKALLCTFLQRVNASSDQSPIQWTEGLITSDFDKFDFLNAAASAHEKLHPITPSEGTVQTPSAPVPATPPPT